MPKGRVRTSPCESVVGPEIFFLLTWTPCLEWSVTVMTYVSEPSGSSQVMTQCFALTDGAERGNRVVRNGSRAPGLLDLGYVLGGAIF